VLRYVDEESQGMSKYLDSNINHQKYLELGVGKVSEHLRNTIQQKNSQILELHQCLQQMQKNEKAKEQ
jgi:hypothetical protein